MRNLRDTFVPKRSLAVIGFLESVVDHPILSSWAITWLSRFATAPMNVETAFTARANEALSRYAPKRSRAEIEDKRNATTREVVVTTEKTPLTGNLVAHFAVAARALAEGRVVPFIGPGINFSERLPGQEWRFDESRFLPSGLELSRYLAEKFGIGNQDGTNLEWIAQYVATTAGSGWLYDELRGIFNRDYRPTEAHRFFCRLSERTAQVKSSDPTRGRLVIATTNFDDLLERAFEEGGQAYHRLSYIAEGESRGRFLHRPPGEEPRVVANPSTYQLLLRDQSPVILKLLGTIERQGPDGDSFVITEDQHINLLTKMDLLSALPHPVPAKLVKSHSLFLGVGLEDWTTRAILSPIWGDRRYSLRSWAVRLRATEFDIKYWATRDVEIIAADLREYVDELEASMSSTQDLGGRA